MKLKKVSKRHKGLFGNQHKNHSGFALESFGVVYPVLCNPCESKKKTKKIFTKNLPQRMEPWTCLNPWKNAF